MTNLFAGIKQATAAVEVKDTLGGGKFNPVESGIYAATIKYAYLQASASGSLGLHMEFELNNDSIMRESLYMTKTTGENFYVDKNDSTKQHLLQGFITAQAISLLGAQEEVMDLTTEEKIIKLYDSTAGAEVPTPVPMLTALIGKTVKLGVIKIIEDKQVKSDKVDDKGKPIYVKGDGVRIKNEIDKVFHPTNNMTVPELRASATEPAFYEAWSNRWTGKVNDKSTGTSGTGGAAADTPKPKSLFR